MYFYLLSQNFKYVFVGCGFQNEWAIQMGVIGTPFELFTKRSYAYGHETQATPLRNFFIYYSSTKYEPLGFGGSATIKFHVLDVYNSIDETKMSAYTAESAGATLYRCGFYLWDIQDFYEIVFYSA